MEHLQEMSFSARVKKELGDLPLGTTCCAMAEAYGALLYASRFSFDAIQITTASNFVGERLEGLFAKAFGLDFDSVKLSAAATRQSYLIESPEKIAQITDQLGYDEKTHLAHTINLALLEASCCIPAFLRGAFLTGGAVTDPLKTYHLELVTRHQGVSRGMMAMLGELGFAPKMTMRRGNAAVYFKKSEAIEDFLTNIGASGMALLHMTTKVEKHMKNAVQRKVNCDAANVEKSVIAAEMQLLAIRKIETHIGLESLPEKLYQTAILRVVNPEANLGELAELADPPVTKSCMSHRLKKIIMIGESTHAH